MKTTTVRTEGAAASLNSSEIAEKFAHKIEEQFLTRLQANGIKPGSAKALKMEGEFFPGAMAALQAVFPSAEADKISPVIPIRWVIAMMRGDSCLES